MCISALIDQGTCSNSIIPLISEQNSANEKLCLILNIYLSLKDGNKFLILGRVFPRKLLIFFGSWVSGLKY